MEIVTRAGQARVEFDERTDAAFLLVLTHGAGGGVESPDLLAVRQAGLELGAAVARVTQPWRLAGARAPGSVAKQDEAWLEVIAALRGARTGGAVVPDGRVVPGGLGPAARPGWPLVVGGRSNGARLACRTAAAAGAVAVVALAFPLHPPGRADDPGRSRAPELRNACVLVLVVNGERDPFGVPAPADVSRLVVLPGEVHALSRHPELVGAAVRDWLPVVLGGRA